MGKLKELSELELKVLNYFRPVVLNGMGTLYSVSRDGDVFNHKTGKIVPQFICSYGNYKATHININGVDHKCMIHRPVATAFIPNPDNKPQVNHKDANTFNNSVDNLEWVTPEENIHHSIKLGHQIVGIDHKNSKHTEEQIRSVCALLENPNNTIPYISSETGVSIKTIQNIRKGGWKHISSNYNIPRGIRKQGPKYSPISRKIIELVNEGKSNDEIYDELRRSGLSDHMTNKSLGDRIYHIRRDIDMIVATSTTIENYKSIRV